MKRFRSGDIRQEKELNGPNSAGPNLEIQLSARVSTKKSETQTASLMAASFRWILQLHKDVPKAARFYSEGLDFTINVCSLRWAELQSGSLKLALMHSSQYFLFSSLLMPTMCSMIVHC